MKIAIFKNPTDDFTAVKTEDMEKYTDFIRISEYLDVDFVMLPDKDVVGKQVAALEQEKQDIQANTQLKLNTIDQKIGELLALPPAKGESDE